MPGKKIWNSDLDLKGKAIVNTVPNATGTVLTWNPLNKEVSTRTNLEFTNDLSLMTTNTVQQVTAQKIFNNVDFPFQFRYTGTKSWTIQKVATGNSLAFLPSTTVNGTDVDTNNWIGLNDNGTIYTSGVYKRNSNDGYFLLGGSGHMLTTAKEDSFKTSIRNADGILITTDLDYSQTTGSAWMLELKGNMYGGGLPLFAIIQGYVYNDTMINTTGFTTVDYFNSILVLNLGGKVCFYFPKFFYWQGFSARVLDVTSAGGAATINHVVSIEEQIGDPGGTKRVTIPITPLGTPLNGWTGLPDNTNWVGHGAITQRKVIGELPWRYYGNGHTIFDASAGVSPNGVTVSKTDSQIQWTENYPMLVGWNGVATYGLKVDTARRAEELGNYHAVNYVTVFSDQEIYGLKKFNKPARNTGTDWGNTSTLADYTIGIFTDSGPDTNNNKTASLGFYGANGVQAGIYVRSNDSNGTSMAFATTNLFSGGPQIAMTINNLGTVDFPRACPTVSGNIIFHNGNTIDYDHVMETIISVGYAHWGQRKVLSTFWNGTYGDHVILSPPGLAANTATFKMSQNGNAYVNDKRVLTEVDFNPANYVQSWEGATALGFNGANPNSDPYIYSNIDGVYHYLATTAWTDSNFFRRSGGTLTGGGKIDSNGDITVRQSATGRNATGMFWRNIFGVDAPISGIGSMTQSGNLDYTFMGWGAEPWDGANNFAVSETRLTYKGYDIFHAGNLNPVRIGGTGTAGNPVYLGWDNTNLRITVDSSYIGYVWHSNNLDPVTRNSYQEIIARKVFSGAIGNTYDTAAIMVNGNGSTIFPTIGFHQSGIVGATLSVRNDGNLYYNDKIIYHNGNLSLTGIVLNQDFTTASGGTNNHVGIVDNSFGDESGLWDLNYEYAIAIKCGDDYLYGGSLGSYTGLSWNISNQNVGIGMKATTAAKVNVQGAVKASGNFKSTTESDAETFIANGTTAQLDREVKNVVHPNGGTVLRVEPAEYFVPSSSTITVDDENRFLVIIGEQSKQVVNLKNIYPRQSISIYNFDPQGYNLEVRINGSFLMEIPALRMQEYWVTQDQRLIRKNGQVEIEFIY